VKVAKERSKDRMWHLGIFTYNLECSILKSNSLASSCRILCTIIDVKLYMLLNMATRCGVPIGKWWPYSTIGHNLARIRRLRHVDKGGGFDHGILNPSYSAISVL